MTNEFDLIWYYEEIAIPTFVEFAKQRTSIRLAILASISLYHVLDYINAEQNGGLMHFDPKFSDRASLYLLKHHECLGVLEAVANAAKHKHRKRKEPYFYIGWTVKRPPARAGIAIAGLSRMGDKTGGVEVHYDGKRHDLFATLTKSIKSLEAELPWLIGRADRIVGPG